MTNKIEISNSSQAILTMKKKSEKTQNWGSIRVTF